MGSRDPLPTDVAHLPPIPASFTSGLDGCLDSLGMALSPVAREAIEDHVRLLQAWNAAVNLTAIHDPAAIARDLVADSLTAVMPLREWQTQALLDIGSGGGFPGFPLAVAVPVERAMLVESTAKKARFLEALVGATDRTDAIRVAAARAEELAATDQQRERWPAVTVRAVGSLLEVVEIGLPLVAVGGRLLAWKRRPIEAEVADAEELVAVLGGQPPEIRAAGLPGRPDNVLVVVEKARPTPAGYPRDPAVRRRRPDAGSRGLRCRTDADRGGLGHPCQPARPRSGPRSA